MQSLRFALWAVVLAAAAGADEKKKPSVLETIEPFKSHGHVYDGDSIEAMRPRVMGTHGVIATGHYLATLAGMEALRKGGNAFDAGVSAAMALKVIKMDYAGWTGVAPLILYSARDREVVSRVGAGYDPRESDARALPPLREDGYQYRPHSRGRGRLARRPGPIRDH